MGDTFCYVSMNAGEYFWAMRMQLREGAWGKDHMRNFTYKGGCRCNPNREKCNPNVAKCDPNNFFYENYRKNIQTGNNGRQCEKPDVFPLG